MIECKEKLILLSKGRDVWNLQKVKFVKKNNIVGKGTKQRCVELERRMVLKGKG